MNNFQQQLPYYPYNNVYRFNIFLHKVFVRIQDLLLTIKYQIEDNTTVQINIYNTFQNTNVQNNNIQNTNTYESNTSELLAFYQTQYTKLNELITLIQKELSPLMDVALIETTIEQTQFMYIILSNYLKIVEYIQQWINNTVLKNNPDVLQEIQYMIRKIQIKLDNVLQKVINSQNNYNKLITNLNMQND